MSCHVGKVPGQVGRTHVRPDRGPTGCFAKE
jgi:hypothetical protein